MRINSVRLYNFSSYYGLCEFDFSVTPGRNVVLIGGNNGAGKTSLFTAIKLALYGPLCFKYQGANHQYSARIKELINRDVFARDNVEAFVELDIELPGERDVDAFHISRRWRMVRKRVQETYTVRKNGALLDDNQLQSFEKFLYARVSPQLFDFFFFDGEEIAEQFSSIHQNRYIEQSFLTLHSFDNFNLIKRFCEHYVSTEEESDDHEALREQFEAVTEEIQQKRDELVSLSERQAAVMSRLDEIKIRGDELEVVYRKSGAMTDQEEDELTQQRKLCEKQRDEAGKQIREFVEEMLPFFIVQDIGDTVERQLVLEEQVQQFRTIENKLAQASIKSGIAEVLHKHDVTDQAGLPDELIAMLTSAIRPDIDESFLFLHDLSQEQRGQVFHLLNHIKYADKQEWVRTIQQKNSATKKAAEINRILRDAVPDIDTQTYLEEFTSLSEEKFKLELERDGLGPSKEECEKRLEALYLKQKSLRKELKKSAKNINSYHFTEKVGKVMGKLIGDVTSEKKRELEKMVLDKFRLLLRKDDFIDRLEIDDEFNILMYKSQTYSYKELYDLVNNVGYDELIERIGNYGVQMLFEKFELGTVKQLRQYLRENLQQMSLFERQNVNLYKKIEYSKLSRGEKQVFIMAFYWALIENARVDIPFIIDTPFARIDTAHRELISRELIPAISSQVIILSTDEEITEHYYNLLAPHIAKEYLLSYNEREGRTEIEMGYFVQEAVLV